MEVHYINTCFPYTETESFMDLFEGLGHVPVQYTDPGPAHDHIQENPYWSMNTNAYKYGFSGPGSASFYAPYEVNDSIPSMEYSSQGPTTANTLSEDDASALHTSTEECIPSPTSSDSSQVVWQDDIDLDNMTYEELLDLGEAVGTQSRGLSPELINLLPTSKCKFKSLFSRKKADDRCVICQRRYKIGDKQTKLPCEHVYHSACITKWLGINKVTEDDQCKKLCRIKAKCINRSSTCLKKPTAPDLCKWPLSPSTSKNAPRYHKVTSKA